MSTIFTPLIIHYSLLYLLKFQNKHFNTLVYLRMGNEERFITTYNSIKSRKKQNLTINCLRYKSLHYIYYLTCKKNKKSISFCHKLLYNTCRSKR
jgi:ABC-type iron transport system FetAB permease component